MNRPLAARLDVVSAGFFAFRLEVFVNEMNEKTPEVNNARGIHSSPRSWLRVKALHRKQEQHVHEYPGTH
jgi:hypothetical protein